MRSSLLSLTTGIRLLVSTYSTYPVTFILWIIKQSKIGFIKDSGAPRIDIGYLVKVFPNVSVTRLGRPLDLGLTVPV